MELIPRCDCTNTGYKGELCEEEDTWEEVLDIACLVISGLSTLTVPFIVVKFKRDLEALPPMNLPEGEDMHGWPGFLMFCIGVVDMTVDLALCLALLSCGRLKLLMSCLGTTVVTTCTTLFLGFSALRKIKLHNRAARDWYITNGTTATIIVFLSSSRVESISILRLRLRMYCYEWVVECPMSHEQFHFLRYEGIYHYWLEDIPHIVVAVALFATSSEDSAVCGQEYGWLGLSAEHAKLLAFCSIISSMFSIVFGSISKNGQQQVREVARRSITNNLLGHGNGFADAGSVRQTS